MDKESIDKWLDWATYELPPGPLLFPQRYMINAQKAFYGWYLLWLMVQYNNFSTGAYLYLVFHGSYGYFWLLKEATFPDASFKKPITLGSLLFSLFVGIGPLFWLGYYYMSSEDERNERDIHPVKMSFCIWLFTVGVVVMMGSDGQKYWMLRERKGLITDGLFKFTRNPNYLGESMIYLTFGIMINEFYSWLILANLLGLVFHLRMHAKDLRMQGRPGFKEYKANTWQMLPKLFNSTAASVVIYGVFGWWLWEHQEVILS